MSNVATLIAGETLTITVPRGATKIIIKLHKVVGSAAILEVAHDRIQFA